MPIGSSAGDMHVVEKTLLGQNWVASSTVLTSHVFRCEVQHDRHANKLKVCVNADFKSLMLQTSPVGRHRSPCLHRASVAKDWSQ